MKFLLVILGLTLVLSLLMARRKAKARKKAQVNRAEAEAFLAENKTRPEVKELQPGLQLEVLQEGAGSICPKTTDLILVHYHGTLLNGAVFDSSINRNEPIRFQLNRVIKGWTEALQQMVEGQRVRLYIHPDFAYGDDDMGSIPPGSMLIFDVELLKIGE